MNRQNPTSIGSQMGRPCPAETVGQADTESRSSRVALPAGLGLAGWKRVMFFALLVASFAVVHHSAAQAADTSMTAHQFARAKGLTVQDAGSHLLMQGVVRIRLYPNRPDATVNGHRYVLKDVVTKSGNEWVLPSRVVSFLSRTVDANTPRATYTSVPRPSIPSASPYSTRSSTPHAHALSAGSGFPAGSRVVRQGSRIFVYPPSSSMAGSTTVVPAQGAITRSLPYAMGTRSRADVARRAPAGKRSVAANPARKSGKRKFRSIDELMGGSKALGAPLKSGAGSLDCAPVSSRTWVPPTSVKERKWRWVILHHSDDTSGSAAKYHKIHLEENGWENGLGYHFVIGNGSQTGDGEVEVGPRWVRQIQGAHAKVPGNRYNEYGVGICLVGDFEDGIAQPTSKQFAALVSLCKWLMKRYGIAASDIQGHCDCCDTACPGKNFPWAKLRARIGR